MRKLSLHTLLLCILGVGCSESEYGVVAPQPTLSISVPATAIEGQSFPAQITIHQQGVSEGFSLSILLQSGQAAATLDGSTLPTSGKWTSLKLGSGKLAITPTTAGLLSFSLQVRSADGGLSQRQTCEVQVSPASGIVAKAQCDAQLLNPQAATRVPIRLEIAKDGYDGQFSVTASVIKGKGKVYKDNYAQTDTEFMGGSVIEIEYDPEILGEHIVQFSIKAEGTSTLATAYVDVVKDISVVSNVTDCFTFSGIGRHNTEGKSITLALENYERYNFHVAGWYADGKLLTTEQTYTLKLSKGCLSALSVKLAQRIVTLQRGDVAEVPYRYVIYNGQTPVFKYVYDQKTSVFAEHNATEMIAFRYPGSQYNTAVNPPVLREYDGRIALSKGYNWCGYFWRAFDDIEIYLHKADNPGFEFNYPSRFIESPTTCYHIPESIIMQ